MCPLPTLLRIIKVSFSIFNNRETYKESAWDISSALFFFRRSLQDLSLSDNRLEIYSIREVSSETHAGHRIKSRNLYYDALQPLRYLVTFPNSLLPPSPILKTEAAHFSETVANVSEYSRYHN